MFLIMWQKRFSENENEAVETHLHDIWIPRPKSRNIEIPRHFFRVQKATTSRFQDQKATTSSFCGILTLMSPNTFSRYIQLKGSFSEKKYQR